jgi:hypothetical protein
MKSKIPEKGHHEELEILYECITRKIKKWPIELWDMAQTTELTFIAANQKRGIPIY